MIEQKHPSDMSEDERQALVDSDPAAFDQDVDNDASNAEPDATRTAADDTEPEVERAGETKGPDAEDDSDGGKPVDTRAFNGVLAELRSTRQELKELRERMSAQPEPEPEPERDFEEERQALRGKYDTGELDDEEYEAQREALLLEQAETRALARLKAQAQAEAERTAQAQAATVAEDWTSKINAWVEANQDFCSNAVRLNAVQGLIQSIGADPNLSNEDLLKRVEKEAFEAFNWSSKGADKPHAARNANDAAAAARASAAPPSLSGGMGVGNRGGGESGIDVAALKPGQFSKLPKAEQERLLGEGALD